ncbi:hypothetical protein Scep_028322 [Stephania cephalantha]|uniref:Uncharacterized protein n=1 Tax=Stephania cephalantha TaxID=152367 RepID=A0AAP0EBX8_9MAGN
MSSEVHRFLNRNRRTIADIERDMISDWFSQITTQQPLQEDMQLINPKLQNSKTQVTIILEHLMDEKELSPQPIFYSNETVNTATLKSVEFDEFSIVDEYLSEPNVTLAVSSHEPDITITHKKDDEAEKEIGVISERPEESQIESEEDQPMVPNELPILKEGVHFVLPKAIDAPFVVDISKGEGIM